MNRRLPLPTPKRRRLVQDLGAVARDLDAEAAVRRELPDGAWNAVIALEVARSAGSVRLAATLTLNGTMDTPTASFALASARAYLALVRRADLAGVIR